MYGSIIRLLLLLLLLHPTRTSATLLEKRHRRNCITRRRTRACSTEKKKGGRPLPLVNSVRRAKSAARTDTPRPIVATDNLIAERERERKKHNAAAVPRAKIHPRSHEIVRARQSIFVVVHPFTTHVYTTVLSSFSPLKLYTHKPTPTRAHYVYYCTQCAAAEYFSPQ